MGLIWPVGQDEFGTPVLECSIVNPLQAEHGSVILYAPRTSCKTAVQVVCVDQMPQTGM